MWQRAKTGGRASLASITSLDRFWGWTAPTSSSSGSLGSPDDRKKLASEAFWPTTLDKECDKAARILRSFCKDGFHSTPPAAALATALDSPKLSHKALKRLPEEVIRNAKGLAIFTTMRSGLWISGAGGSGVLVARLPDGRWSPPSAILLHTDGVAFLVDADMYDCVLVINTQDAMRTISDGRYTIGSSIGLVSGPVGSGDSPDSNMFGISAPMYAYMKSRGQAADIQLLGTIVVERADENERFYRRKVTAADILGGRINKLPAETSRLIQTIKASQGDTDVDPSMLPIEGAPSDFDLADGQVFGVPSKDDPDPFGFLALEKEGLVVREAGSQKRVSLDSFQFNPSPNSPLFNSFNRGNTEVPLSSRSSWRTSVTERSMQTIDMATQTEADTSLSSLAQSGLFRASMTSIPETQIPSIEQKLVDDETTKSPVSMVEDPVLPTPTQSPVSMGIQTELRLSPPQTPQERSPIVSHNTSPVMELPSPAVEEPIQPNQTEDSDADDEDADEDDEVVIHEVVHAMAPQIVTATPQIITKARLITVNKPPPAPALPPRNPIRNIVPRTPSPSLKPFRIRRPSTSEGHDEKIRPTSSGASSVYSLKKDQTPSSAGATESLGSISSIDDGELIRTTSLDADLDRMGISLAKDHIIFSPKENEGGTTRHDRRKAVIAKVSLPKEN